MELLGSAWVVRLATRVVVRLARRLVTLSREN